MPWTSPETFTAGQTLTSASMNIVSANARMGGPVFTNEAARDAAITSPEEGMTAYLTAPTVPAATGATTAVPTGVTTIYNGSAWVCVTEIGARSSVSATTISTSYVTTLTSDATAVSVTCSTGTTAMLGMTAMAYNGTGSTTGYTTVSVSGATTIAAADVNGLWHQSTFVANHSSVWIIPGLTAGTNTFTLNHKISSGTLYVEQRRLWVKGVA